MSQRSDANMDEALWVHFPYRQLVQSAAVSNETAEHAENSPLRLSALHVTPQKC